MAIDFSSINNYSFPNLENGYAEDIKTFWETFVEPRLPKKEFVIAWHELLMRYVNESDSIFVIRAFYNTDKDARRGFLTKTDKDFFFTYSDNGYAKMIAKMVYAGIIPQYEEFKKEMKAGTIPISEFMSKEEKDFSLYSCKSFNYNEYKLAHIIDAGKNFSINGQNIGLAQICNEYFPAGNIGDWKKNNSIYIRNLTVSSEAKEIITAHFLRFVDPLNYFITPKPLNKEISYQESETSIKDIAEYNPLQSYAIKRFSEKYGVIYNDFLKLIKLPSSYVQYNINSNDLGKQIIKIHFGKKIIINTGKKPLTTVERKQGVSEICKIRYSSNRLEFKRDLIEPLNNDDVFIIDVTKNKPTGSYAMTKADFYKVFKNVISSTSYKDDGIYHYPKTPQKALQFLQ